jgi:hypothetical protein
MPSWHFVLVDEESEEAKSLTPLQETRNPRESVDANVGASQQYFSPRGVKTCAKHKGDDKGKDEAGEASKRSSTTRDPNQYLHGSISQATTIFGRPEYEFMEEPISDLDAQTRAFTEANPPTDLKESGVENVSDGCEAEEMNDDSPGGDRMDHEELIRDCQTHSAPLSPIPNMVPSPVQNPVVASGEMESKAPGSLNTERPRTPPPSGIQSGSTRAEDQPLA